MDPVMEKLKEYGLGLREKNEMESKIRTVVPFMNQIKWEGEKRNKIKEVITDDVQVILINFDLFIGKMGITTINEATKKIAMDSAYIDLDLYQNEILVNTDEYNYYYGDYMENHIEENKEEYALKYPEWQLKRVFNKEKADDQIRWEIVENIYDFREQIKKSDKARNFCEELKSVAEQVIL